MKSGNYCKENSKYPIIRSSGRNCWLRKSEVRSTRCSDFIFEADRAPHKIYVSQQHSFSSVIMRPWKTAKDVYSDTPCTMVNWKPQPNRGKKKGVSSMQNMLRHLWNLVWPKTPRNESGNAIGLFVHKYFLRLNFGSECRSLTSAQFSFTFRLECA